MLSDPNLNLMREALEYVHPAQIFDEFASVTPLCGGMSHERLAKSGLAEPAPTTSQNNLSRPAKVVRAWMSKLLLMMNRCLFSIWTR